MLGKIFENLLDAGDRKAKGAFYTPREIVHYMCQESLINYLVNEVGAPYEDIKQFILYGELIRDADSRRDVGYGKEFTIKQSIYDNIVKIDEALKNVKVADPAVGSGAFPLGMLNEIVKARNNITEYIVRKDKEGFFGIKYGEGLIRKKRAPYQMKLDTIKSSIFAVDIEPSAVDIAKLRLWLSIVVDQEINADNHEPKPLPNLDINIHIGNSLIDEYEGIKLFDKSILNRKNDNVKESAASHFSEMIQLSLLVDHTDVMLKEMFALQDRFFDEDNEERKKDIKEKIDQIRDELIRYKLQLDNNTEALTRYQESLRSKTKPYFIWEMEFAKVFKDKGGFDIVIANPPYGANVTDAEIIRKIYKPEGYKKLGSKDSFGLFSAMTVQKLLKVGGIYAFIQSDTWHTIRTHKELRRLFLDELAAKYLIQVPTWIFGATVNTSIFIAQKEPDKIRRNKSNLYACDFTNIPNECMQLLSTLFRQIQKLAKSKPTKQYAVYNYEQSIIEYSSNIPFFIGSPKLFSFMQDVNIDTILKNFTTNESHEINTRQISINGNNVEMVKLGDISEIKQGLETADNQYYLRQFPNIRGSYKDVDLSLVFTPDEYANFSDDEKINGINPKNYKGKYLVPLDKGGESNSNVGWLPNYWVPTGYFIDWTIDSVNRLKKATIADCKNRRNKESTKKEIIKKKDYTQIAAVIRNPEYYFKYGITFSRTGIYAPTFRIGSGSVFSADGATVFSKYNLNYLLGILTSKVVRYLLKNYIGHSVHVQVEELKELPVPPNESPILANLVAQIISKQKNDLKYPYHYHEQKEIELQVYKIYCLKDEDIEEIKTWYERRYSKLSKAQDI